MRVKDPCQKVIPCIFRVEVLNFSDVEIMILSQLFISIWRILMSENHNFIQIIFFMITPLSFHFFHKCFLILKELIQIKKQIEDLENNFIKKKWL